MLYPNHLCAYNSIRVVNVCPFFLARICRVWSVLDIFLFIACIQSKASAIRCYNNHFICLCLGCSIYLLRFIRNSYFLNAFKWFLCARQHFTCLINEKTNTIQIDSYRNRIAYFRRDFCSLTTLNNGYEWNMPIHISIGLDFRHHIISFSDESVSFNLLLAQPKKNRWKLSRKYL